MIAQLEETDAATEFFELIVEPAIAEYDDAENVLTDATVNGIGSPDDARALVLRRARTASIELHQFTGRVLASAPRWSRGSKIDQIRDWLRTGFVRRVNGQPVDDLAILHDVADAFKHAQLTRKAWFLETDRAVIRTATGFGRLSCGEGKFGGAEQVIVELLDGRQRALSLILWTVRDAWAAAMGKPRRLFT